MINRLWHGWTKRENADAYELREEVLQGFHRMRGSKGAHRLRRDVQNDVEFVTITVFDSLEAVKEFAGEDCEVAVVPRQGRKLLSPFDARSAHSETVFRRE